MIEYRILSYIFYKNKQYIVLNDKKNKYFFLENDVNNNTKKYISLNELVELSNRICKKEPNIMQFLFNRKKTEKIKIVPKVIIGGVLIPLTFSILQVVSYTNPNNEITENISYTSVQELDSDSQQRLDEFYHTIEYDMDTFELESIEGNNQLTIIYDSAGLDSVFNNTKGDVTYDDIREAINNLEMPEQYKDIYITLANNLERQYPGMDLRIWLNNLNSLNIVELTNEELKTKYNVEYGAYDKITNTIYLQSDYEYIPGSEEYQIIVHEFCHPIKTSQFTIGTTDYITRFSTDYDNYFIINEAMNSILALRSYDQEETRIAYTLPSHMIEIMIECMDNYSIEDYVNEDLSYFIEKLNETNGDNLAIEMLNLIELHTEDTKDNDIHFSQEQFYDLYDYIARMYYNKYITPNMSSEEIEEVKNQLVTRLITDIPETCEVDTNHFNDFLIEYCNENNINYTVNSVKTR